MNEQVPSDYPELLEELRSVLAGDLLEMGLNGDCERIALVVTERIRTFWGGQQIYIPVGRHVSIAIRDLKVEASFTGDHTETRKICRRFNLTARHVYRIVNEVRAARRNRLKETTEAQHEIKTGGSNV